VKKKIASYIKLVFYSSRYVFVYTSAIQPLFHFGMPKLVYLYFEGPLLVKTFRGNKKPIAENVSVATCLSSL